LVLLGLALQAPPSLGQAADPVATGDINPVLQGIPLQDLTDPASLATSQAGSTSQAPVPARVTPASANAQFAEPASPLKTTLLVFGGLLMLALVVAGITLTLTALHKDTKLRKRRYRRRSRRSAAERVLPQQASQP
jgi:hypothetical protein